MREQSSFVREAVEGLAFAVWLRTGLVDDDIRDLFRDGDGADIETKGNPYHDPKDGRFTFAPGGAGGKRGYRGMTKHGRGIIEPVGGGGTDRNGKPRPELFAPDPYALKTPAEALAHYMGGSGEERNYYFNNVDTSQVRLTDFPKINDIISDGKPGLYPITDASASYPGGLLGRSKNFSSAATVGRLVLQANGMLAISANGRYSFSGTLAAKDDPYNFDASRGRSQIGEASTTVGRQLPGEPFLIHLVGSKPFSARGHRSVRK